MIEVQGEVLQKDGVREAKKYRMLLAEKDEEIARLKRQLSDLYEMIDREVPKKKI